MSKTVLLLFTISLWTANSFAQEEVTRYGYETLKKAGQLFCEGDTTETIKLLESYSETHRGQRNALEADLRLCDFYMQSKDYENAITRLKRALEVNPQGGYLNFSDTCKLFLAHVNFEETQSKMCQKLSDIYILLKDYAKADSFLILADTKYLPRFGGCGNGMIMYRTKLSLNFADLYLTMGDTTKAINRLLDYFMSYEAYQDAVTAKLKKLLLAKYTQEEVTRHIEKAIKKRKVRYDDDHYFKYVTIIMFGHTVSRRVHDDDEYIKSYVKHKNMLALMSP